MNRNNKNLEDEWNNIMNAQEYDHLMDEITYHKSDAKKWADAYSQALSDSERAYLRAEYWKAEHLAGNVEIERLRIIEAAAVAALDFDQWQGDEWYEAMMSLQKSLHDSYKAVCQNCDGTGDVTNQIGEYLGPCNCGAPSMFQAEVARIDAELKVSAATTAKPVAWVRFCSDGSYEGPIMDARMEDVRKQSGAWTPLFTHNR